MKLQSVGTIAMLFIAAGILTGQESVCDLFLRISSSDRNQVVVTGDLIIGRQKAILGATACDHRYSSHSRNWPVALALRPSPLVSSNQLQQLHEVAEQLEDFRQAGKLTRATATFSGKLQISTTGNLPGEIIYDSFENLNVEIMPDADSMHVISICDLFKNLPEFRDRRIAVIGELVSVGEGNWIIGHCEGSFYTDNYRWPVALNYGQPAFESDETESIAPVKHISPPSASNESGEREILTATFAGLLRMRSQYSVTCTANGWFRKNGFGHLKAAAAELVVDSVGNVQFAPAPPGPMEHTDSPTLIAK